MPHRERDGDGRGSIALVLGGGAPNLTLMSGALSALDENGVKFDIISSLGAGMLVALLYAAPKPMTRQEELLTPQELRQKALATTRELGVEDTIYNLVPVNYKVFHKVGPLAELYTRAAGRYTRWFQERVRELPFWSPALEPLEPLVNDWVQLFLSTLGPTDLNPLSLGMCQAAPWIENVVDFEALRGCTTDYKGKFFISAYCVDDRKMEMFPRDKIGVEQFRACLAMPFIYEPYRLGQKTYFEGSAYDTFNFEGLFVEEGIHPDILIVSDILGREKLLRRPKQLLDAFGMSIMVPIVAMARDDLRLFCLQHLPKYPNTKVLRLQYDIEDSQFPHILDWSRTNLTTLYEVGRKAGKQLLKDYECELCTGHARPGRAYWTSADILERSEYKKRFIESASYYDPVESAWIPKVLVWQEQPEKQRPDAEFAADLRKVFSGRDAKEEADSHAVAAATRWIYRNDGQQIPQGYVEDLAERLAIHFDIEYHATDPLPARGVISKIRDEATTIFARIFNLPVAGTQLEVDLTVEPGSAQINIKPTFATLLLLLDIYGRIKTDDDLCRDFKTAAADAGTLVAKITTARVIRKERPWKRNSDLVNLLATRHQAKDTAEAEAASGVKRRQGRRRERRGGQRDRAA